MIRVNVFFNTAANTSWVQVHAGSMCMFAITFLTYSKLSSMLHVTNMFHTRHRLLNTHVTATLVSKTVHYDVCSCSGVHGINPHKLAGKQGMFAVEA